MMDFKKGLDELLNDNSPDRIIVNTTKGIKTKISIASKLKGYDTVKEFVLDAISSIMDEDILKTEKEKDKEKEKKKESNIK